jgi:hypothetical protein
MLPEVPVGTIAALALTFPLSELSVDTNGWDKPVGHVAKYPSELLGMTVKFRE